MLFAFVFSYIVPLASVAFFYTSIVRAVLFNKAALKRAEIKMMQEATQRRKSLCPPTEAELTSQFQSNDDVSI